MSVAPAHLRVIHDARVECGQFDVNRKRDEHRSAVHKLTREGREPSEIAARVGISDRQVHRLRKEPDHPIPELDLPDPNVSDERAAELERLVELALHLACAIRDENPMITWKALSRMNRRTLQELAVVLLAMVDVEATITDLLSWVLNLPAAQKEAS